MMRLLRNFGGWLETTFVGPRGYTIYADGRLEQGIKDGDAFAFVDTKNYQQVFGRGAELDGHRFFVPGSLMGEYLTHGALSLMFRGRQSGLMGEFRRVDGQSFAVAEFVWYRSGPRASTIIIWWCLFGVFLVTISGSIAFVQGILGFDDVLIIGLMLIGLGCAMFSPRVLGVLGEKVFNDLRRPVIAKLSALVQHQSAR